MKTIAEPSRLFTLPAELIWKIFNNLSQVDLSIARLVSKTFLKYSDDPSMWRHIHLKKSIHLSKEDERQKVLWKLTELVPILQPHLSLIRSISICGVRDNIVQYLLLNCPNLEELTIDGWTTLSEHAFDLTKKLERRYYPSLPLRKLKLLSVRGNYYTSLDAAAFGRLMHHCPHLEELSIVGCQIHLHADYLLRSITKETVVSSTTSEQPDNKDTNRDGAKEPQTFTNSLRYITLATKRTWSTHHIIRLFQICSRLCWLGLVPTSSNPLLDETADNDELSIASNDNDDSSVLRKDVDSIEGQEITEYDTIFIHRSSILPVNK